MRGHVSCPNLKRFALQTASLSLLPVLPFLDSFHCIMSNFFSTLLIANVGVKGIVGTRVLNKAAVSQSHWSTIVKRQNNSVVVRCGRSSNGQCWRQFQVPGHGFVSAGVNKSLELKQAHALCYLLYHACLYPPPRSSFKPGSISKPLWPGEGVCVQSNIWVKEPFLCVCVHSHDIISHAMHSNGVSEQRVGDVQCDDCILMCVV